MVTVTTQGEKMALVNNEEKILHDVRVRLYPNRLPNVEGKYFARTSNEAYLSIERVCSSLKERGGFTGNYHDLVNHVRRFFDEAAYQLCDGFAIDTGYYSIHPVIGGTFDSPHENTNREKHPISFNFNARPRLRALAGNIKVVIDGVAGLEGNISEFHDYETDTVNDTATPGGIFSIFGDKIKIKGDDPSIGVYFVAEEDSETEVKVETRLMVNTATKLTGKVPPLGEGLWKLAVRTQYSPGSFLLKEPRLVRGSFFVLV